MLFAMDWPDYILYSLHNFMRQAYFHTVWNNISIRMVW